MANQRQIAEALGVSQSTVSLALRGSSEVGEPVRERVIQTARQMGYQPSMYANRLTAHIRSGKKMADHDTIALVVDARSMKEWIGTTATYEAFYKGVCQKAFELGQTVEPFFLQQPRMDAAKLDRILYTRGIHGIIMAPPYLGNRSVDLTWSRYAAVAIGFGREEQDLTRVVFDQLQNYTKAFDKLRRLGYRRIGTVLPPRAVQKHHYLSRWHIGHLHCQNHIPTDEQIPVLVTSLGEPETNRAGAQQFKKWIEEWTPDAVITITGNEKTWIEAMGKSVPEDLGVACLSRQGDSDCAGIHEQSDAIGAAALELVAARVFHNEFSLPTNPTTIMIHGIWQDGPTVRQKK